MHLVRGKSGAIEVVRPADKGKSAFVPQPNSRYKLVKQTFDRRDESGEKVVKYHVVNSEATANKQGDYIIATFPYDKGVWKWLCSVRDDLNRGTLMPDDVKQMM